MAQGCPPERRRAKGHSGKAAREKAAPGSHVEWMPAADRPDPVALLEEQNATREPDLVPVRHGRMMVSPFTFYRGAAKIMAADLKDTPRAGLDVQLCGDAHLSNFGLFASPERTLLFDLNDFDETLPGPFEYDVKRMAASFTVAARDNSFKSSDAYAATLASVSSYREAMAGFASMRTLDVWYARESESDLLRAIKDATRSDKIARKGLDGKAVEKGAEKIARESPLPRQFASAVEARRARGRQVSDRQSAADRDAAARPGAEDRPFHRRDRRCGSTSSSAPIAAPCRTTGDSCSSGSKSWTPRARSSASGAWVHARSSSCCKVATKTTRCSCR